MRCFLSIITSILRYSADILWLDTCLIKLNQLTTPCRHYFQINVNISWLLWLLGYIFIKFMSRAIVFVSQLGNVKIDIPKEWTDWNCKKNKSLVDTGNIYTFSKNTYAACQEINTGIAVFNYTLSFLIIHTTQYPCHTPLCIAPFEIPHVKPGIKMSIDREA